MPSRSLFPPERRWPLLWEPDFSRSHAGITSVEPLLSARWPLLRAFFDDLAGAFFFEHLTPRSRTILRDFERGTTIRTRSIHDERY